MKTINSLECSRIVMNYSFLVLVKVDKQIVLDQTTVSSGNSLFANPLLLMIFI